MSGGLLLLRGRQIGNEGQPWSGWRRVAEGRKRGWRRRGGKGGDDEADDAGRAAGVNEASSKSKEDLSY